MKRLDSRGVALVDVVACAAFVLVAAGIAAPALSRLRVASKTTRCQENLKHFVTTSKPIFPICHTSTGHCTDTSNLTPTKSAPIGLDDAHFLAATHESIR